MVGAKTPCRSFQARELHSLFFCFEGHGELQFIWAQVSLNRISSMCWDWIAQTKLTSWSPYFYDEHWLCYLKSAYSPHTTNPLSNWAFCGSLLVAESLEDLQFQHLCIKFPLAGLLVVICTKAMGCLLVSSPRQAHCTNEHSGHFVWSRHAWVSVSVYVKSNASVMLV